MELQQFNIKFQHIQGKKNVVADAISQLRTLGLYQDNGNKDIPLTTEDVIENIIDRGPSHRCHTENTNIQCREGTTMQLILQEQGQSNENKAGSQLPTR